MPLAIFCLLSSANLSVREDCDYAFPHATVRGVRASPCDSRSGPGTVSGRDCGSPWQTRRFGSGSDAGLRTLGDRQPGGNSALSSIFVPPRLTLILRLSPFPFQLDASTAFLIRFK